MRISDWSSDVCSSDLIPKRGEAIGIADPVEGSAPDARAALDFFGAAVGRVAARCDDRRTVIVCKAAHHAQANAHGEIFAGTAIGIARFELTIPDAVIYGDDTHCDPKLACMALGLPRGEEANPMIIKQPSQQATG